MLEDTARQQDRKLDGQVRKVLISATDGHRKYTLYVDAQVRDGKHVISREVYDSLISQFPAGAGIWFNL